MRRALAGLAGVALLAAGCASPADVANYRQDVLRNNARALAENDAAYQSAVEWNVRVLGLPASGAIVVYIVAMVAVVAIAGIFALYRLRRVEELNKMPCSVCGASYKKRTES